MPIRLRCPQCSTNVVASDELRGKVVRCPKCRETFRAEDNASPSTIRQAPAAKTAPPLPARPAPATFRRTAPRPVPRGSHGLLIVGLAAAAGVLLLFVGAVALAAWLLWPRSPAAPATVPVAAVEAPAPQLPAADNPPADGAPFHLRDVRKSVVFIRRSTPGLPTATGTGFFVSKDGVIATCRHVIQPDSGPDPATVLYVGVPSAADPDVLDYFKAQVAFCSPARDSLDFALLKIAARPGYQEFRPLPLATTKLDLGAPAAAIGFPFASVDNPVLSFNKGSISATRVEFEGHPFYQTDAAVNPGNSGGPLINGDGQAVGVITLKLDDANNMGFALYLSETGLPSILDREQVARFRPEAGPLDAKQLPAVSALAPTHLDNWKVTRGAAAEEKGLVVAENQGASYWLTNKDPLPENFQLMIECYVVPILPRSERPGAGRRFGPPLPPPPLPRQPVNMNLVRSLYVRFGTDATEDEIMSMNGTTIHLSAAQLQVAESGAVVATERKGVPADPFVLTVTRRGDVLTVAVNGETWTRQTLKRSLQGPHKFSIGGFQSGLLLHAVSVTSVEGPPVPPPIAGDPPKPRPSAPLTVLAFDAGWDKPLDPDGDCKIVPNKTALTIEVPAARHDLSVEQGVMNAPRLLRDVTGDFTIQVKVGGVSQPAAPSTREGFIPYLGAGLVLIAGDQTCLRLERAAVNRNGQTSAFVNWEVRAPGQSRTTSSGLRPDEPPLYLRLRRQGNLFFPSFSRDGATWIELPQQPLNLPDRVKVGLAAVTTSAATFKATFDDFRLGASGEAPVAEAPKVNPPKTDPKIFAVQPPAGWKGPQWTNDLDKMKVPDGPASGWVMGADFKVEDAVLSPLTGWLTLKQGQPFAPGGNLTLMLSHKSLAELEGKTFTVAGKQEISGLIWVHLNRTPEGEKLPKTEMFGDYTLKLEFGKAADGKLPGKIYICLPDDAHSVIAGAFQVESK